MTARLPMDVRMLVSDAESQAKRHGHGAVTPLHLIAALASRGIAEEHLTTELSGAVDQRLRSIEPDFASPTPNEETVALLDRVAADPDPMRSLISNLVEVAQQVAASTGDATPDAEPAGTEDRGPRGNQGRIPSSTAKPSDSPLTPAQRTLVTVAGDDPPLVGRPAIVHRLISMLGAREPQHVLLVGKPGSGRTTVARALSAELNRAGYGGPLAGCGVFLTRTSDVLANRAVSSLAPLSQEGILVIDDVDVLLRLGGAIDFPAAAAVRSIVANVGSRVVLVASAASVDRLRAADGELLTQVETCHLPALCDEDVFLVAQEQARALEAHHDVSVPPDVIASAVLPVRLTDSKQHPALAVRRLDRAAAAARLRSDRTAQASDLGADVSPQQYVSFDADRASAALGARVFGQDRAIRAVADRLSVTRASLDLRPERPDGVFLFAGPTGTGKTALALELAREIYGTPEAIVRLDMSEFAENHTVSKLYGSPPGYVGSTDPDSWLTTRIRHRPQCVLLLDEIEKAHAQVWNVFLQVFDAGTLTDSLGNRAEFGEVVVVMTSNIGAEAFADKGAIGFLDSAPDAAAEEADVHAELRRWMRPELLNRLDGTIVFRPLEPDVIRHIARHNLDGAVRRLAERGWTLTVDDAVEELLVQRGFSREYGARPLLRALEDIVLRPLAGLPPGTYRLDVRDHRPVVTGTTAASH